MLILLCVNKLLFLNNSQAASFYLDDDSSSHTLTTVNYLQPSAKSVNLTSMVEDPHLPWIGYIKYYFISFVTKFYITFPELIYLIIESLYLWTTFTHFIHLHTLPLATTNLFSEFAFLDYTYK